jgi:DNA-binding response OmpR family regulator
MPKSKINILLAEDDKNLGLLLCEFLNAENFSVTLCDDGEKALKAFNTFPFDICLLDVMMPKLDGFELAKAIRKKNKTIPIVFITARSLKEDKLKGYDIGADDYITKPFEVDELIWKIKALLRRTHENESKTTIEIIALGDYLFDYQNQSLTYNGIIRRITEKENEILFYHYF